MTQEQDERLPIRVRASYMFTNDELVIVDVLDHRIECDMLINFADPKNPVIPDATAIEFNVRNHIEEILARHPKFGGEDAIKPWVEITQMSWTPAGTEAEKRDIPWLLLPLMSPRQLATLYMAAYRVVFDET